MRDVGQFVGCSDRRRSHGQRLFTCEANNYMCPALIMRWLDCLMPKVIREQFYCKCPIGITRKCLHLKRERRAEYYYHCHCDNPGSLQCMSAFRILMQSFKSHKVHLYDFCSIVTVKVCCDTWLCCPITYLGCYICHSYHGYWFLGAMCVFDKAMFATEGRIVTLFEINPTSVLCCVECSCSDDIRLCREKMSILYNFARITTVCSFPTISHAGRSWIAAIP